MEQRREARLTADQPVCVTVLGQPDLHLPAQVKNVSGRGLGLKMAVSLDTGTAVKIVLEDAILMGEVIYSRSGDAGYYVGIELEHALYGLAELARIMCAFSEESSGPEHPHAAEKAPHQHQQQSRK
jgi:PilZ domain